MWYFIIRQRDLDREPYQALQKQAALTETELFNEPYENLYVFSVERENYTDFIDALDTEGTRYDALPTRPTREELLAGMRLG